MSFREIMDLRIAGNDGWQVLAFFITILAFLIIGKIIQVILNRMSVTLYKNSRHSASIVSQSLAKASVFVFFSMGFKVSMVFLTLNQGMISLAGTVTVILISLAVGFVAYCLIDVVSHFLTKQAERTESKLDDMLVPMVCTSLRVTVVLLTILQIIQSLTDKPLTSILAGLGVGGLAVALASQDALKNFFGSIVIFADKPFEVGDRIVVDSYDGNVEEVGFRSSKVRTLDGNLVTIPNADLANKIIQNVSRRPYIRNVVNIGLTYDTSPEQMVKAKKIIGDLLKVPEINNPANPPRVYFNQLKDWSLNIQVSYWFYTADYWKYMEFTETLNFEIMRQFNDAKIQFAFPTQTVHLKNEK